MRRLRIARWLFLVGSPLVIGLHVATARSQQALVHTAGLLGAVLWAVGFAYVTHAHCPRCGTGFFARWRGACALPLGVLERRPHCGVCGQQLGG